MRTANRATSSKLSRFLTLLVFGVLLATTGQAQDPGYPNQGDYQAQPGDADPPARAARISSLRGTVSLEPSGSEDWGQAMINFPMSSGDRLYADQNGRAELQVGNSAVRIGTSTDLTLTNLTDNYLQLGLATGSIHVRTYGLNSGDQQEIDTPNGAILIQQPGDIRVTTFDQEGVTTVEVFSGLVQLSGPGLNQTIGTGSTVQLSGTNPIYVSYEDFPGEDDFDIWSTQRDRRMTASISARYVSRQMPGYDELDQYGQWDTSAPEYGAVWYPQDVPYGWTPYSVGYWAQVGPWGWTWVDTTGPWGYAPFHYGRWALIGARWGWVPGPPEVAPVYSPALVAFAGGGGFSIGIGFGGGGIAAWFPLGPRDPYIPWYHCSDRYVTNVNITNVTVINRTYVNTVVHNYNVNHTAVNNIRYVNVSHVTAVQAGNFAGKPIRGTQVQLTPEQLRNIHPVAGVGQVPVREPVRSGQAGFKPVGLAPAARPVAVAPTRPSVITPRGVAMAQPGAQARPVPKGLASVNSTRPASPPREGAVTGSRPLPAPSSVPVRPMPAAPQGNRPVVERTPATTVPSRPEQPARPQTPSRPQVPSRPPAPDVTHPAQADVQRQQQLQQQRDQQLKTEQEQQTQQRQQQIQRQQQDQQHQLQMDQRQQDSVREQQQELQQQQRQLQLQEQQRQQRLQQQQKPVPAKPAAKPEAKPAGKEKEEPIDR